MLTSINSKKRILFVITQSDLGGAQQFIARLITLLDKNKFSFTLVSGSDGNNEIKSILPPDTQYLVAENLKRNPHPIKDILGVHELRNIILARKPDILFLNSSKAGFIGALAAKFASRKLPNLKTIYRIGGWTFNDPWPAWKRWVYKKMEQISAPWKDYIILNNSLDLELAKKFNIVGKKEVKIIYNGIDPYVNVLEKEEARQELKSKLPEGFFDSFIVGTIANFYPAKDIANLINAAKNTPDKFKFLIIGDGHLRPEIDTQIRSLGLRPRFFLLGKIPNAHRYLRAFDVFALPSVKEGFPWSVLEAMAAKVPVIATNVGAIPEIIEDGKSGLIVPPRDPHALAQAIIDISNQTENGTQEMVIQAHQTIVNNFSIRKMIDEYEKLFLNI
jgi:glycosyltransferase involved in cell wall biosynthesis